MGRNVGSRLAECGWNDARRGGNRVATAFVQWMAAGKPLKTEPDTFRRPVDYNCLAHVHRARRVESAGGWKQGGKKTLVEV